MSAQVLQLVQKTIDYTRESLGVTDAALGDIRPDNTSAIVAAAEQTAAPLVFQKLGNHQLWEDLVNIFIDLISEFYGVREIYYEITDENGAKVKTKTEFDFSRIDYDSFSIKVNIGNASYWSQLMQIKTLDAFFGAGIINDAVLYLEHLPEGYVPGKAQLIRELEERRKAAAIVPEEEQPPANLPVPAGNPETLGQLESKLAMI